MNFLPNKDQLFSIVRSIVIFASAYVVGKGWVGEELAAQIGGVILGIAAAAWGVTEKTKTATVAKAADIVPISAAAQAKVGIENPILVPTSPKVK